MSGHSKWATIKRKKGAQDAARGKLFAKLIRQIEVAARDGDPDPDSNPTLSDAIQRAKDNSVPKDTIERAVKRGSGDLDEGVHYDPVQYEGYAAGGVAVLVDCLTDNRNRTASDVRSAFTKVGGSLGDPGSVAYMFTRQGQVILDAAGTSEDDLLAAGLEHGLADLEDQGEQFVAWCDPTDLRALRKAFEAEGVRVSEAKSTMIPATSIPVTDAAAAKQVLRLIDMLEDSDDVQDVYANFDISDDILEAATSD